MGEVGTLLSRNALDIRSLCMRQSARKISGLRHLTYFHTKVQAMHWFGKQLLIMITHEATAIAIGGALGANARFWLGKWVTQSWGSHFPVGTFLINVSGSLLLAAFNVLFLEKFPAPQKYWLLLLGTGFCGGFTTFSTFTWETFQLLENGKPWQALGYALGSVLVGFVAVALGVWALRRGLPDGQ